jgi:catechol 2,3-dioxygenase-like lactoylglutathione lyase family enzyme
MAIFTHLTVGTNDLAAAGTFFDAVLAPLGLKRLATYETGLAYGKEAAEFYVLKPRNGEAATAGNGFTIGFVSADHAGVDAFYREALAHGATCEGGPGPRAFAPNAYCAYVRTPEGHKCMAGCFAPQ